MMDRESLSEWAKDKPLSILRLDPADRAVLRIAGKSDQIVTIKLKCINIQVQYKTTNATFFHGILGGYSVRVASQVYRTNN